MVRICLAAGAWLRPERKKARPPRTSENSDPLSGLLRRDSAGRGPYTAKANDFPDLFSCSRPISAISALGDSVIELYDANIVSSLLMTIGYQQQRGNNFQLPSRPTQ